MRVSPRWTALALVAALLTAYIVRLVLRHLRGAGDEPKRIVGGAATARTASRSPSGRKRSGSGSSDKKKRSSRKEETADDPKLPTFLMLMGISGSGKSTWAREFVFRCDASFTIVSSDEIRKQLTGRVDDQTRNAEVWEVVLNHVAAALKQGKNVLLDATNTQTDRRRQFVRQLPPCNKHLKVFNINKSIAKSRVAKDLEKGVDRAATPDGVIDLMYRQFQDSLAAVKDEGWHLR